MLPSEAALKPHVELLKLLPIGVVNSEDKLPQRSLKCKNFKLSFIQEPGEEGS